MKGKTLFLSFFLLTLLACGDREEGQLLRGIEETWQLCEVSLPEAKARAEAMKDSVQEASEYVRQKFDLLSIRLRDKQDMVPSSPDSAKLTASFFECRTDVIDKERACYYLASAYRDLKDYPRAMSLFLRTVSIAEQGKGADTLIWQNALSQLRYLYMLGLNYEEELNVAKQAAELAKASGRSTANYLMDVASAYEHLNDTLQCLHYCDLAYKAIQAEHFPQKYGKVMAYMMALYSGYCRYEEAGLLLQHLSQIPESERPHNYELCLARYHEGQNRTDSAIVHYIIYNNKATEPTGRYEAAAGLQRCYFRKGDFRQAALWGQHLDETNDTIIRQRAFEQTQRARDAFRYHRDEEAERAIMQRGERIMFFAVIIGLAMLSVVLGLAALYYFRKKKFMEELTNKERLLEQKARVNKELTRIALMNIATDKAGNVIAYFNNIAIGRAQISEGAWEGLMAAIETLYPDFLETVQSREAKPLHEPLLQTICLLKIGMKPAQIAKVMDAKIQTVWNRVKRAEVICGDLLGTISAKD
ncbi:MAG: hypothetical protein IJ219_04845 [Bacteroidaceae bacterium]|nr:hypothetical protein [Bacteroidaceae bacterium]